MSLCRRCRRFARLWVVDTIVLANMREVGAPVYMEEELAFARELGKSISPEEKLSGLRCGSISMLRALRK